MLEARNLTKKFTNRLAVENLSFSIDQGQVYGLLGQNGAGKSTLIRMLLGLIFPDSGEVYIRDQKFHPGSRHLLSNIGAIIERPDLYNYLSGWDNLRIFAALSRCDVPVRRLHEVLEITGLKGREKDRVKTYSLGMKQRLGIAIALLHNPGMLLLDEPTNGLDPQGIAEMRNLIRMLSADQGKTILLSSHLLFEIEQMASHMLILHKGRKIREGRVSELIRPEETEVEISLENPASMAGPVADSPWAGQLIKTNAGSFIFRVHPEQVPAINAFLVGSGASVSGIRTRHSLENYFLSLTND